jgi:hypothetical protein
VSEADYEKLAEQIAQLRIDDVLAGTASTLASMAYAKLGAGEREQARRAIDALAVVVELLEEADLRRDFAAALTNLKVAFVAAG